MRLATVLIVGIASELGRRLEAPLHERGLIGLTCSAGEATATALRSLPDLIVVGDHDLEAASKVVASLREHGLEVPAVVMALDVETDAAELASRIVALTVATTDQPVPDLMETSLHRVYDGVSSALQAQAQLAARSDESIVLSLRPGSLRPEDRGARTLLGDALAASGDSAGAIEAWMSTRDRKRPRPKVAEAFLVEAERARRRGALERAQRFFLRAHTLGEQRAAVGLAEVFLARSKKRLAHEWARRALRSKPGHPGALELVRATTTQE